MQSLSGPLVIALLAFAGGCTPSSPPPSSPTPLAPPEPAPTFLAVTAPGGEDLGLTATLVDSGWGSSGVVASDAPIPYWVMAVIDLEATHDASGLRLTEVELFDAAGERLGRADRELELRVTPPAATLYTDTELPFAGTLDAGTPLRLRLRARMEDAFVSRLASPPSSLRVTMHGDAGAIVRITGQVGEQWPTA